MTKEEGDRPNKKVKFAETLPAVAKGADIDEEDMRMLRDYFVDLVDKLWRRPGYIQKANRWLDSKIKADALK